MSGEGKRSFVVFYVIGIVLVALAGGAYWHYWRGAESRRAEEARERAAQLAEGTAVAVATAQRGAATRRLTLVGEALPLQVTTVYSKVSGYLSGIRVDVGDRVRAGEVLAEVQSPELDAQIATLRTGLENKRRILDRYRELVRQNFISRQALDNAENDVRVTEAQIGELRTLSAYRTIRAPFAGVVTQRHADVGALVTNASSNQTAALPLVTVVDDTGLKVTVYVDQADAPAVRPGVDAEIVDAAAPGRTATGKVARVSGELDARTRTLRAEVEFDNTDGRFLPGSFVDVVLHVPSASLVEVPAGALVMRGGKPFVALVDQANAVRFTPVSVAATDGTTIRIASGLEEGAVVAVSPPASLVDGDKIVPAQAGRAAGSPQGAGK